MEERLPWHQPLWQRLAAGARTGRLPHALLLSGPGGLGKDRFARQLSHALLCHRPGDDLTPCGQCRGCRLLAAGSHPDFTRVEPEEPGKPIKVDRIRKLCDLLGQTAQGRKVALITPAEAMNPSAANALLKTLEEPSAGSLLLLVTAFAARLPATVRSRCQILAFAPPPREQALAWLNPRVEGFPADLLLDLAGGAPLAALEQADETRLQRRRDLLKILMRVADKQLDPISAAEAWSQGETAENLRWLVQWHMDLIRLKAAGPPARLLHPDLAAPLQALARRVSGRTLFQRLEQAQALERLARTPVNLPLQLEGFLMEWAGD